MNIAKYVHGPILLFVCSLLLAGCGGGSESQTPAPSAPVNVAPTVSFISDCNNLVCSFTSTSSDPDGSVTSLEWTFPDGSNASANEISYTFAESGSYNISLQATDNNGANRTATNTIDVFVDFHSANATVNLNDSSVIWSQDFNHRPDGAYSLQEFAEDIDPTCASHDCTGIGKTTDMLDSISMQHGEVKVYVTEDKRGTGVFQRAVQLDQEFQELYLTFKIRFDQLADYDNFTGKFMGLGGHPDREFPPTGCMDVLANEGFSVRYTYDRVKLSQYTYHQNKTNTCGDSSYINKGASEDTVLNPGINYIFELRVKMNTPGQSNGIVETKINGITVAQDDYYNFSDNGSYGINTFLFTFQVQDIVRSEYENVVYFDDIVLSTQSVLED